MGMATSLEVRVPFLDNRIVDFVCRIPSHYRMRGFTLKRLLKAALKGVVPDLVLNRAKRGFGTPMGTWLRTDFRPMVEDLLAQERIGRDGMFNVEFIKDLLAAHYAGVEDYTEAIFALSCFRSMAGAVAGYVAVTTVAVGIVWGASFLVVYVYIGYPILLWIITRLRQRAVFRDDDVAPTVTTDFCL